MNTILVNLSTGLDIAVFFQINRKHEGQNYIIYKDDKKYTQTYYALNGKTGEIFEVQYPKFAIIKVLASHILETQKRQFYVCSATEGGCNGGWMNTIDELANHCYVDENAIEWAKSAKPGDFHHNEGANIFCLKPD